MLRLALMLLLAARAGALAPLLASPRARMSPGGLGGRPSGSRRGSVDLQQAAGARIGHVRLAAEKASSAGGEGTIPVDGVVELRGIRTRRVAWDDAKVRTGPSRAEGGVAYRHDPCMYHAHLETMTHDP